MKTNRISLPAALVAAALGSAVPAMADDRAAFMRELARTDGNPQGDNAIPLPSGGDYVKLTKEQIAFFHQLARTDGNVAAGPEESPEEPAFASR